MSEGDNRNNPRPEPWVRGLALIGVMWLCASFYLVGGLSRVGFFPSFEDLVAYHFAAVVGLPSAAIASFL
jgi:hypothetical protein